MLWNVGLRDDVEYPNIEAETREEAIEIALEWWSQRDPDVLWCDEEHYEDLEEY